MSNQTESKSELILAAVRELLLGDNTATGNTVESIDNYVGNRIQRDNLNTKVDFPKIDLMCEEGGSEFTLPTGTFFLTVKARTHMDEAGSQTTLDRIGARINFLLDRQSTSLNATSAVTGKNLRCRMITKESMLRLPDHIERTFTKTIRYRVECDDEILT